MTRVIALSLRPTKWGMFIVVSAGISTTKNCTFLVVDLWKGLHLAQRMLPMVQYDGLTIVLKGAQTPGP